MGIIIHRMILKAVWIGCMIISSLSLYSQIRVSHKDAACSNYLYIKGESNINEFTFYYNSSPISSNGSGTSGDTLRISIPVKEFEASNSFMYKDFLELMKEEEHPRILVTLSRKQIAESLNRIEACPDLLITIAGVTRKYQVDCEVQECSGNYYLKGKEVIRLSDFKLRPPARLMGMVKVNNEINVDFGFIVNFDDNNKFSVKL